VEQNHLKLCLHIKKERKNKMTKLCSRGKSAAKRKFAVYPSAYANAYASKICAGKVKDPSGVKRKDWKPKGAYMGKFIEVEMNDKNYSNESLKNYYGDLLK
jgi:hypothetical protein